MFESHDIPAALLVELEELVRSGGLIRAIKHARSSLGLTIPEAVEVVTPLYWNHQPTLEQQEAEARARLLGPEAGEFDEVVASWDGDTHGWMVVLETVKGSTRTTVATFRGIGGDSRVFSQEVPPWPEVDVAVRIGSELAKKRSVPFSFPNRASPEIE